MYNKLLTGVILVSIFNFKDCNKSIIETRSKIDTLSKIDTTLKQHTSMENIIFNSSFETKGNPSLAKWNADTILASLVKDVPPEYGKWSLQLIPGWYPQEGFAETYVTGIKESGIFKLTVWMKSLNNWEGSVSLRLNNSPNIKKVSNSTGNWSMVTLTDTILLNETDTLFIRLSAGRTEVVSGKVLFDNVLLEKIK